MKLKKNIALSETGLVFNPETGESFTVNPVATELISMLRQGTTMQEINTAIMAKYQVEANILEKDVEDFIITLRNFQLIENE